MRTSLKMWSRLTWASRLAIEKELGNYLGYGITNSLGDFYFVSIKKHLIVNFLSTHL